MKSVHSVQMVRYVVYEHAACVELCTVQHCNIMYLHYAKMHVLIII